MAAASRHSQRSMSARGLELESGGFRRHHTAIRSSKKLNLTAVFEPAADGEFTCWFEGFSDAFSEGETIEEAEANLLDAMKLVPEYHQDEARKRAAWPRTVRHLFQLAPA